MGRVGHRRWGLRYTESVLLRAILRGFEQPNGEPTLLIYDGASRGWYLNFWDYPNYQAALIWLERHRLKAEHWRSAYAAWAGSE